MPIKYTIPEINKKKPVESRLTAISFSDKVSNRMRFVNTICICGTKKEICVGEITTGSTKSCGCLARESLLKRNTKYINNVKEINLCYLDMIGRCYNPSFKNYRWYGAKGVIVCKEWREDYQSFLDWSLSNGWQKGLHLDKDIKGDGTIYSPETCMFVTGKRNLSEKGTVVRDCAGRFLKYIKAEKI